MSSLNLVNRENRERREKREIKGNLEMLVKGGYLENKDLRVFQDNQAQKVTLDFQENQDELATLALLA